MKILKTLLIGAVGTVIGYLGQDLYDEIKYEYFTDDPLKEIQNSIDELNKNIQAEGKQLKTFTNGSQDQVIVNNWDGIISNVQIIIDNSEELDNKVSDLHDLVDQIRKKEGIIKPNTITWIPIGQAINLDPKNTFSVYGRQNNTKFYTSLNGTKQSLSAGDRLDYIGANGKTCYVSFLGVKNGNYGASAYCD